MNLRQTARGALAVCALVLALPACARDRAPSEHEQPSEPADAAALPTESAASDDRPAARPTDRGTWIVEGPMRVRFPAGFPPPAGHGDEGEIRGFRYAVTTYESYSELFGLVAASAGQFSTSAEKLPRAELLDGIEQTLLIGFGGQVVRAERGEADGLHRLDLVLRAELGEGDVEIRVVALLAGTYLAQAMLISPNEGGVDDELAEAFFASLELKINE